MDFDELKHLTTESGTPKYVAVHDIVRYITIDRDMLHSYKMRLRPVGHRGRCATERKPSLGWLRRGRLEYNRVRR
jgi:hypothetical protein